MIASVKLIAIYFCGQYQSIVCLINCNECFLTP